MVLESFEEVWFVDFEFSAGDGELPLVRCMVAQEFFSGNILRFWEDDLADMGHPPFQIDNSVLYVAYYASAEMGCHLALGWPMPANLLDLFTEFRNQRNGLTVPCGYGLLGALVYYGLKAMDVVEKDEMRDLALRGGSYTEGEKTALLDYCESDVVALARLLPEMLPKLDLKRALLRGRYMRAAAVIEHNGVPIDLSTLVKLKHHWQDIQEGLIRQIDEGYGVYEGRSFRRDRFGAWLIKNDIPWPVLASGELDLKDTTFREMAGIYPKVAPLRELRHALSSMRLSKLPVGRDGRNRCMLSAFRARTGRNQPSNSRFIFGPSAWLRGLIKPPPEFGIAYLDWSQQEFGIAAALSCDPFMQEAYSSGDPYLAFAKQAGAVPEHGTKQSHPLQRKLFKACVLAVQYGMGAESLARRIGQTVVEARELLRLHRETYRVFWQWSDACLDYAMLHGRLWTTFGWNLFIGDKPNPRSIRNFPMQANGSEMLRLACCMATEADIRVCAPVHDALLIEAPLIILEERIQQTQEIMREASAVVLDGFKLRSDAEVVCYPDRYMDQRGTAMWQTVMELLKDVDLS